MIAFIDEHKDAYGVEPICRELPIAPSTYYAARNRPPSTRAIDDEELKAAILEAYKANYEVYGAEKIWIALRRAGVDIGRDRVAWLMGTLGIEGVTRGRKPRTTKPAPPPERPADLSALEGVEGEVGPDQGCRGAARRRRGEYSTPGALLE